MITGIDIGGSHITAALIDETTWQPLPDSTVRHAINSQEQSAHIINAWTETILELWQKWEMSATAIGIAMPGPFDYEAGISLIHPQSGNDKFGALYQLNIKNLLAESLNIPSNTIRFTNDAAAFLLGEMKSGAGLGYTRGIGITLGTGLGSAVHTPQATLDAARWCQPMFGNIAEDGISTRYLTNTYAALSGKTVDGARELSRLAANDVHAAETFRLFVANLAHFLQSFIADETPEVVIVGGNIANAWPIIEPDLTASLNRHNAGVTLKRATLGELAALTGAACLWQHV